MVHVIINNTEMEVPAGTSVLDAAKQGGITIPTLCHDPRLVPYGGCRLCIVEVEGMRRPVTACTTPVSDGMQVTTESPRLYRLRRTVVELLLSDHPNDCMVCSRAGDCVLQELAYHFGLRFNRFHGSRRRYRQKDGNPFIERDMEKCILCGKCVRVCDQVQGVQAIDFAYRGFNTKVCPPFEKDLSCEFCGQCVAVCPTGALTGKVSAGLGRQMDVKTTDTVCAYCGCGCNLTLHSAGNRVIRVDSRPDTHNQGWLCAKGRFGFEFINSADRLTTPLLRRNKGEELRPASWEEALNFAVQRMTDIINKRGPNSLAGLASARCTNEENYAFQKFFRAAIGTNNIDHCARY